MALEPPLKPPKLAAATTRSASSSTSSSSTSFLTLSSSLFGASRGDVHATTTFDDVDVHYTTPGPLLLDLFSRESDRGRGAFVRAFRRDATGAPGSAETSGLVRVGDELLAINGAVVSELPFASIVQAAKSAVFPLTLTFRRHVSAETRRSSLRPPTSPARGTSGGRTSSFSNDSGPSTSSWAAKLGQMMAESGVKRSASFEKKLSEQQSGGSATSGSLSSPSSGGDTTPTGLSTPGKLKHVWGDGLTLDKVKNSDGMKNLLRMIGGKAKPEEDRETVNMWFDQLLLRPDSSVAEHDSDGFTPVNSLYHSTPIVAVTAGGRLLAVRDDDASEFAVAWYRRTPAKDLIHIKGVASGRYFPSVDDVGAVLSAHVQSLRFPPLARVVEFPRPLQIDPAVGELVDALLEAGAGSFSATLASNEHDSFQLKITAASVTLVKISEDDDDAGVVVSAPYDPDVQLLLDPTDRLRFTLKVKEFGSFLGNRHGDTCSVKMAHADFSCFFLVAQNPQHRDILALLVRRFRARALSSELEDQAHRDELNLFMDPAFASATLSRQPLTGAVSPHSDGTASPPFLTGTRTNSFSVLTSHQPPLEPVRGQRSSSDGAQTAGASRFVDLFHLEQDSDGTSLSSPAARDLPPVPLHRKTSASSSASDAFLHSRVAAQAKEIAMLQEKLSSLSVLLKSVEHEKKRVAAAVEVKDQRIELQQRRLRQLEKLATLSAAETRELQAVRVKLENEERLRTATQQQLERALALLQATEQQRRDQETQTDSRRQSATSGTAADGWVGDDVASQLSPRSINFEMDFMVSTVTTLEQQLAAQTRESARLQDAHSAVVSERNAFRAKAGELRKELRRLVNANRSLADVEAQLAERSDLATQLSIAKAEVKRASDESKEFKDALECVVRQRGMGDKDKDTQRVLSQNLDLQRVVHQLTDSLHETKEQLAALQSINGALMDKLHSLQPDARGSILFESPLNSPGSVASARLHPSFSSDEDDSDDDDDDESDDDNDDDDDESETEEDRSVSGAVLTRSL